ncbi:MAG: Ig-like domain-containing protein [Gemmatimonadetes bacterium]|nr:Ig-like domain-containing protein [Gemmatimonadota bacterium]
MIGALRFITSMAMVALLTAPATAQTPDEDRKLAAGPLVRTIQFVPDRLEIVAGEEAPFPRVRLLDESGNPVDALVRFFARGDLRFDERTIEARTGGEHQLFAMVMMPPDYAGERVSGQLPVVASWPAVTRVAVATDQGTLYEGTSLRHQARAHHADGSLRPDAAFDWTSSDPAIASVDEFGTVLAKRPGQVTISASFGGVRGAVEHRVRPFAATRLDVSLTERGGTRAAGGEDDVIRAATGDVLTFQASARDARGRALEDVPVTWSYTYVADEGIEAPGAVAEVQDGKFVGEEPGVYTVLASAGPLMTRRTVRLEKRDVIRPVQLVGQGTVDHVHSSDIWPYEGLDGRDYAVTGTWGGDGWAYFWDITDPASPTRVDSIRVDARTVNDVKVSPDGRYAALSREGASDRRNGVVIVDLSDPRDPEIASNYDQGLTGGVHNVFATNDYLFALSGGDKYVILDVRDIRNPRYVSEYNHPDSRIHDVWVNDGIAYSSEWGNGVVVVDVGNGRWGGSIENPKFVTNFPVPTGATHAAFPYHQAGTGKTYLILGDEIMSRPDMAWAGTGVRIPTPGSAPGATWGYVHIVDFTDPENPSYVARYEADEFGTHNMWVEDDILYQAYYEGGMRMVDLSGELMGDLKAQHREIAVFKPFDPDGYVANAPMVWGGFTHKGHLFLSDFNSGLWSVKLEPKRRPAT